MMEFPPMNRRESLRLPALSAAVVIHNPLSWAESMPLAALRLTLRPDRLGNTISKISPGYATSPRSSATHISSRGRTLT